MTQRLEEAFRAASRLPPAEQDALAELLLAEVASEAAWDERLKSFSSARLKTTPGTLAPIDWR